MAPLKFSFYCYQPLEDSFEVKPTCVYKVDDEETYERIKNSASLFCGKIFGDFTTVAEISALSYLQTTIAKALEILEGEDVNVDELEKSIKADPQLAVSLIKYANSPLIAPPSPIKDIKHAIVYLGLNRLKQFLLTLMMSQMASVDKEFEEIALKIAAYGFLAERLGSDLKKYNQCQLFLSGIIYGAQKVFKKPASQLLDAISPPRHCLPPLEDTELKERLSQIKENNVEKTYLELKRLLGAAEGG